MRSSATEERGASRQRTAGAVFVDGPFGLFQFSLLRQQEWKGSVARARAWRAWANHGVVGPKLGQGQSVSWNQCFASRVFPLLIFFRCYAPFSFSFFFFFFLVFLWLFTRFLVFRFSPSSLLALVLPLFLLFCLKKGVFFALAFFLLCTATMVPPGRFDCAGFTHQKSASGPIDTPLRHEKLTPKS